MDVTLALYVAALLCLTVAAVMVALPLGVAVGGLSLAVIGWLVDEVDG